MNDFKPSELPVDTTIERIGDKTRYTKQTPGVWSLVDPHCIDCSEVVLESATMVDLEAARANNYEAYGAADQYFDGNFTIVAMPFKLVWALSIALNDEYEDTNVVQIIKDYVEHNAHEAKREAERAEEV